MKPDPMAPRGEQMAQLSLVLLAQAVRLLLVLML